MNKNIKSTSEIKPGNLRKCGILVIALSAIMVAEVASAVNNIYNSSENIVVDTTYDLVYVGNAASNVILTITDPGSLTHTQDLVIGTVPGSNNNQIVVGTGAELSNNPPMKTPFILEEAGTITLYWCKEGALPKALTFGLAEAVQLAETLQETKLLLKEEPGISGVPFGWELEQQRLLIHLAAWR